MGAGLAALAGGGCADNEATFIIRAIIAPSVAGAGCVYTTETEARLTEGRFDVLLANRYMIAPLLQSSLISRADPTAARIETSSIQVQGFVFELHNDSPQGSLIAEPFTVYQGSFVPASLGGMVGRGFALVQSIPPEVAEAMRAEVCIPRLVPTMDCPVPTFYRAGDIIPPTATTPGRVVRDRRVIIRLRAFGRSTGGVSTETPFFDFPVTVCCGCLLTFPPESDTIEMPSAVGLPARSIPDCRNGSAVLNEGSCNPGQDFPADCRLCSGYSTACNPPGFTISPTAVCPR